MAAHTPGPWLALAEHDVGPKTDVFAADDLLIADCGFPQGVLSAEVMEANARLCAAAPELLAACEQAEDCIDPTAIGGQLALEMVRAAIAKARGA